MLPLAPPNGLVARVVRWSVCNAHIVVGITLAITIAAALAIPRIRVRLDARALLPADAPELRASDELARLFGRRDIVVVALVAQSGTVYAPDAIAQLRRVSARLEHLHGVVPGSVVSLSMLPVLTVEDGVLDVAPLARDGVSAAELQARARKLDLEDAVLLSRDGRATAVFADVEPSADRREVSRAVRELARDETTTRVKVHVGGNALAQAELGYAAATDLVRLVPLMIVALFAILWLAYRSKWVALVSVFEIGIALVWVGGAMGLAEQSLFVTTLVFPIVLLAVGVSDDVYALDVWLARWDGAPGESLELAITGAFSDAARPIAISALTTIVGLLSTATSRLEPLKTFGLFGALAIAISSLFTFTLVPALLSLVGRRLRGSRRQRGRRTPVRAALALAGPALRWPRLIGAATVVVCIAACAVAVHVRVNDSWVSNLPRDGALRGDTAVIDHYLGGMTVVDVAFERPGSMLADPATFGALVTLDERIRGLAGVGAVSSVIDPMLRTLAQLGDRDVRELRTSLTRGELVPAADLDQTLLLLQSAAPGYLAQLVDPSRTRAQIRVFVRDADALRIGGLVAAIKASAGDARITPFGDGWISYVTVDLLVTGQLRSIAIAAVVTLLLMLVVFRSLPLALAAALPVLLSIVIVLAILATAGIALGVASSLFAAIGLGIGADYALHLGERYRRHAREMPHGATRRSVEEVGPPILTSACAVSGAMLLLLVSASPPNQMLGLLVAICLVCGAVLTLLVLPALTGVMERFQ